MLCASKGDEKNNQMGPCVCQVVSKGEGRKKKTIRWATRMSHDENFFKRSLNTGF